MRYIKVITPLVICLLLIPVLAQQPPNGVPAIEKAITEERIDDAAKMIRYDIQKWLEKNNIDTLIHYISLKGKISEMQNGAKAAVKEITQFVNGLTAKTITPLQSIDAHQAAAYFFESIYEMQDAYDAMEKALSIADQLGQDQKYYTGKCEYNLGVYAYKMGNIGLAQKHHISALRVKQSSSTTSAEELYFSYNAVGTNYWHELKHDSAGIYFNKALDEVKKMPVDNINQYFRPALIKNNLVAIYREDGNTSKALATAQEVIYDFRDFLKGKGGDSKKQYATESWCVAIDNLAGIYQDIGDYKKAENLLLYAYQQKQEKLKGSYDIAISEILLGQIYNKLRDFSKAEKYLESALNQLREENGDYTFWRADAQYALAILYEKTNRPAEAAISYNETEKLYEQAYGGVYDNTYADFINNKALFLASINRYDEAMNTAGKIDKYLASIGTFKSVQHYLHLLNLAEIKYISRRYSEAISYCDDVLSFHNSQTSAGSNLMDSIKAEVHKPKTILLRAQSLYAMQAKKDSTFLLGIYQQLDTALQILEKRKVFIDDPENVNLLMSEYQDLINFFAEISLELYHKTSVNHYLEKFINIREAALYSRIRSRLNKEKAIRFSNVPEEVITTENDLKEQIQLSLSNKGADNGQLDQYLRAVKTWDNHLSEEKKNYPQYYRLRYATLFYKLPELQELIPDNTTLVRYYYTDTSLVALVADHKNKKIVRLNADGLASMVNTILQNTTGEQEQLKMLYQLHQQIWAPLQNDIQTKKVMVIPDGVLYNVSIDMLPFEPVSAFRQLADKSLLSRHAFSYHYSPFMLEAGHDKKTPYQNYVAFAPGFSDNLKNDYLSSVKDSLQLDRKYLTLLPQPANNKLAQKINDQIGGEVFLNGSSTAAAFRDNADKHKIIHVATHAEYNNVLPEESGLFFAKGNKTSDNNFITLNDIYQCSMNADLMILTACESGKPGFQDGEGLISLAHAFNYAGSQNILTALWKIDEQSSAVIVEEFINLVEKGLETDEALRQAKLSYLQKNDGRVLAPAYWSGLVLMGKPLSISLDKRKPYWIWIAGGVVLAVGTLLYRKRVRASSGLKGMV